MRASGFVKFFAFALCALATTSLFAQPRGPRGEFGQGRGGRGGQEATVATVPDTWMAPMKWRPIGPANMSGRITSIAVYEADPNIWWAATASGGLLKTTNNGITFEHQFDRETVVSIGDVQVFQGDANIIWVGTGESNPRNSASWGNGVYKSTDGGKSWQHLGLDNSFQIGRIALHPTDPNIAYVGALGRLWGPNEDRGLYKTTDGGKTWNKIFYVDDKTGVIDVQMNPTNPDVVMFATYERQRDGFDGNDPIKKNGPGSAIYITRDAGATVAKLTQGLPTVKLGRIGISWYRKDPNYVYAVVESEKTSREPENAPFLGIRGEDAEVGSRLTDVTKDSPADKSGLKNGDIVVRIGSDAVTSYQDLLAKVRRYEAGQKATFEVMRDRKPVNVEIEFGKKPASAEQPSGNSERRSASPFDGSLGGQNENMQDQQGSEGFQYGGLYQSADGGSTWKRINSVNPRPMYYSQVRVDPSDLNHVYVLGTSLYQSHNGGHNFTDDGASGDVHPDNHALWIDPRDGRHMILGNDGGLYVTYDRMATWDHHSHVAIGQFYHVGLDTRRNYNVYGGLQDNGSWGGPSRVANNRGPVNSDWFRVGSGDGFVCLVDPEDPDQIYFESQNGGMGRIHLRTGERGFIRPRAVQGVEYRFNWKTPFLLSPHNSKIFYSAGNYVFRSAFKGNSMEPISPELTRTKLGSGSAIAESPVEVGVLYVGTTDGYVWVSRDGGKNWANVFEGQTPVPVPPVARNPELYKEEKPAEVKPETETAKPEGEAAPTPAAEAKPAEGNAEAKPEEKKPEEAKPAEGATPPANPMPSDNPLTGLWEGRSTGEGGPRGIGTLRFGLTYDAEAKQVKGSFRSRQNESPITGTFDPATNKLSLTIESQRGTNTVDATLVEGKLKGSLVVGNGMFTIEFEATRTSNDPSAAPTTQDAPRGPGAGGPGAGGQGAGGQGPGAVGQDGSGRGSATPAGQVLKELVPQAMWISSLEASRFQAGRVYMTVDGHRSDVTEPYVFASEDYGATWRSIRANIPANAGTCWVIREDISNPDLLLLGCEFSCWFSIDRGLSWTKLNNNLPTVAVHEFAIHPTAGEVVAATHGRSLWVLDMTTLRQLTGETLKAPFHLYKPNSVVRWMTAPGAGASGTRRFVGENPSSTATFYYSLARDAGEVSIEIRDINDRLVRKLDGERTAGLHALAWDLRRQARTTPGIGVGGPAGGRGGFGGGPGAGGQGGAAGQAGPGGQTGPGTQGGASGAAGGVPQGAPGAQAAGGRGPAGGQGAGQGGGGRGGFGGGALAAGTYRVTLIVDEEKQVQTIEILPDPENAESPRILEANEELDLLLEEMNEEEEGKKGDDDEVVR